MERAPSRSRAGGGTGIGAVRPVNDAPVTQAVLDVTDEDSPVTINPLGNDSDADGDLDVTSVTIASAPANGTAFVNPINGNITYTPNQDFNGEDTFVYEVSDLGTPLPALTGSSTVTVSVNAINDPPVGAADTATAPQDAEAFIPVLDNDSDVDRPPDLAPGARTWARARRCGRGCWPSLAPPWSWSCSGYPPPCAPRTWTPSRPSATSSADSVSRPSAFECRFPANPYACMGSKTMAPAIGRRESTTWESS